MRCAVTDAVAARGDVGAGQARLALLIGYGNPLRGDDGVGWHVADAVRAALRAGATAVVDLDEETAVLVEESTAVHGDEATPAVGGSRLRIITEHQLTPEMASDVAASGVVVFVDAACDCAAGVVRVRPVGVTGPASGFTQHQFDPGTLLWLAREVYGRMPASAWLITIGASAFACEQCLSPPVRAGVSVACSAAVHLLDLTPPTLAGASISRPGTSQR
jgi:hydrogenase maturation protease